MKKIFLFLLSAGLTSGAFAQKLNPEIKDGTQLNASVFVQGQAVPLAFTIKSAKAPVTLVWSVDGYGDGEFVINEKALESGTSFFLEQPELGTTKLSDKETYGLISKQAFKSLTENKSFTYHQVKFTPKATDSNPLKINGKEADVIRVSSEDNKIELWILNNPNLPLILQTAGMPFDISVFEIK
ncbi:hypothetical protein D9M68_675210 [compost metagenome]